MPCRITNLLQELDAAAVVAPVSVASISNNQPTPCATRGSERAIENRPNNPNHIHLKRQIFPNTIGFWFDIGGGKVPSQTLRSLNTTANKRHTSGAGDTIQHAPSHETASKNKAISVATTCVKRRLKTSTSEASNASQTLDAPRLPTYRGNTAVRTTTLERDSTLRQNNLWRTYIQDESDIQPRDAFPHTAASSEEQNDVEMNPVHADSVNTRLRPTYHNAFYTEERWLAQELTRLCTLWVSQSQHVCFTCMIVCTLVCLSYSFPSDFDIYLWYSYFHCSK
jgi:hypothetical protein